MSKVERAYQKIEDGYATMMTGLFILREAGLDQEAYDELGTVLSLIMEDRQYLRENKNVVDTAL